ncbi:MAG: hypothetical protein ACI9C1_001055 [Candidatus Aldehydirespiratoraceae bacterium]|jgi:hypothetical protein
MTFDAGFDTPLSTEDDVVSGPFRRPLQMLHDQEYGGHSSIHDGDMAAELGFTGAPIEGPTHFSQFVPLLAEIWGQEWFERGCFSSHYQNMVVEGEEVRAFVAIPAKGATITRAWAEKADGTPVLEATASLGATDPTILDERRAKLRPPEQLVILEGIAVGMTGRADEPVEMGAHQHMGALYPFSLADKITKITESSPWYAGESPWGGAIIPLEMVSVLVEYTAHSAGFAVKGPSVGLFADQEIRMIKGPLMVDAPYVIRREVAAVSESRRTESYWVRSSIHDAVTDEKLAEMLLNHAVLKDSYANYPKD